MTLATGYDVLTSTTQINSVFPTVPWVLQYDLSQASALVDVSRVVALSGWNVSQDVNTSFGTYYFINSINAGNYVSTTSNYQTGGTQSEPTSSGSLGVSLVTTQAVGINFFANSSFSLTGTANPNPLGIGVISDGTTSNSTYDAELSFTDTKGTLNTADDITSYLLISSSGNNSWDGTYYHSNSVTQTTQRYSINGISFNGSDTSTRQLVQDAAYNVVSAIVANNITDYRYSDTSSDFSISYAGTVVKDLVGLTETFSLTNLNYSTSDYSVSTASVASFTLPLTGDPNNFLYGATSVLDNGSLKIDDITAVKASADQYILPEALKGDNVFNINNANGASVAVGGGNDQIYGAAGSDTAVFDFARGDITSISTSGDGLTITINTASEQKILSSIEELVFTDQTVSMSDFLMSRPTGYNVLTSTIQIYPFFPTIPWVKQYDLTAASALVDVSRVSALPGWNVPQDVNISNGTYTFNNGGNTVSTSLNQTFGSQGSQPTYVGTQGITLITTSDVGIEFSANVQYSAVGSFNVSPLGNIISDGTTSTSTYASVLSYSDTKGTASQADDVTAYALINSTGTNYKVGTNYYTDSSGSMTMTYRTDGISFSETQSNVRQFVQDATYNVTKALDTSRISSYSYSDAAAGFSISYAGTREKDLVGLTETFSLTNLNYSARDYSVSAASVASFTLPLTGNPNFFFGATSVLNSGSLKTDDITAVKASADQYILPEAIKGDNIFRINNVNGASVTVGGGNDQVYGAAGVDAAVFDFARGDITSISASNDGLTIMLKTLSEQKLLSSIEQLVFTDQSVSLSNLLQSSQSTNPLFSATNSSTGYVEPTRYTGPVSFLEWEVLGGNTGDVVIGARTNDFMNLLGGDDAANGAAGRDVLDGGTGSSFLTGGTDADTFFVDGRNAASTWSTVTDFHRSEGDTVNMWGWRQGVSKLVTSSNDGGAAGYTGATFHYDLDGNGAIDTSITFAGLTTSQVGNPTVNSVAGNSYLLWA